MSKAFNWLHLSDIHVGVDDQSWLWPRSHTLLMRDLERTASLAGPIDTVIFSGDLAQQGLPAEYSRFEDIVGRILDRLSEFGPRPKLLTVPGNHDLCRPSAKNAGAMLLEQYATSPQVRQRFWQEFSDGFSSDDGDISLREILSTAFAPYLTWREKAVASGVHLEPAKVGILPGDAFYTIETATSRCSVVGLNSSWLQLGGGDYKGRLSVHPRQLLALAGDRPDEEFATHDFNLIVTHHPLDWLEAEAQTYWNSDINPAGRFDLHLYGHMHEPSSASVALGGGPARRTLQGASIFGLEYLAGGAVQRIQGYSANCISADKDDRCFKSWPRIQMRQSDGTHRLVRDSSQNVDEDSGALTMNWTVEPVILPAHSVSMSLDSTTEPTVPSLGNPTFDLSLIAYHLPNAKAHSHVRRIEFQRCVAALQDERAVWLISDWGMGEDGFVAAVRAHYSLPPDAVYRLDLSAYESRQSFFETARMQYGASFEHICESVAEAGRSILLLDDIDLAFDRGLAEGAIEADLERLVEIVRDYAPETFIFIRGRRSPYDNRLTQIELRALDEADVAIYVRESELGSERHAKPETIGTIFRHTDGIPTRLDAALKDLELVTIQELLASNPDIAEGGSSVATAPPALVSTIDELRLSQDELGIRSYKLLLALSALPQGERLARIKRFFGPNPFHLSHARALLDRSLIETTSISTLAEADQDEAVTRALVVPRTVRDYIRETMDDLSARSIDRAALETFFGQNWQSGNIEGSPSGKHTRSPLCEGHEIQNCSTLILRQIRRALAEQNEVDAEAAIRLASAFTECLIVGDHYRGAASLCTDVIASIEEFGGYERQLNILRYELARSLRMIGRTAEARDEFEALDLDPLSKSQKQDAAVELALCYERLNEIEPAAAAARRAISIDKKSSQALLAEGILAEQIEDRSKRISTLCELLKKAKSRKLTTLASNFQLTLAREERLAGDGTGIVRIQEVLNEPKADNYNKARAIVNFAANVDRPLTSAERDRLIAAYHYFYHERLYILFNRCHTELWKVFEAAGDNANLLNLFRHSSFIWRLNGREDLELKYLHELTRKFRNLFGGDVRQATRDGAYFIVRVTIVIGKISDEQAKALPSG